MSTDSPRSAIPLAELLPPCAGGVSRRAFCAGAGAGLIALGLPGCDPGGERVMVGGITDPSGGGRHGGVGGGGGTPDGGKAGGGGVDGGGPDDAGAGGSPDLAHGAGGSCPSSNTVNAGAATAIAQGTGLHLSGSTYDIYVCRDASGLFALDSACTHSGCTVEARNGGWYCPCHRARFDFDGSNPTSPAFSPLPHWALCVDGSGNVMVDTNTPVGSSVRA